MLKQSSLCENAPQGHFVAAFGRSGVHWTFSVAVELRVGPLPPARAARNFSLKGTRMTDKKVVLITGGAMGQGAMHAVEFAKVGYDCVLLDMLDPTDERFAATVAEVEGILKIINSKEGK